jgi:membrane associated rhomboid family serine protease
MATQTCFHHPDRETGRACTRCGRPACADCLIQASVGSHCWQCVKASAPPRSQKVKQRLDRGQPIVAPFIIAITVGFFVVIALADGGIGGTGPLSSDLALFGPAVAGGDYYRLVSHAVVHYGPLHLFFNMFILYLVCQFLEPVMGVPRVLLVYFVSILGGAAGALLLSPNAFTGGASGGVFGLAAAATLAHTRAGTTFWQTQFGPLLAINVALSFAIDGVSLGGHLGGLVAGLLATEAFLQARRINQPVLGWIGAVAVGAIAVVISVATV